MSVADFTFYQRLLASAKRGSKEMVSKMKREINSDKFNDFIDSNDLERKTADIIYESQNKSKS